MANPQKHHRSAAVFQYKTQGFNKCIPTCTTLTSWPTYSYWRCETYNCTMHANVWKTCHV